MRTQLLCLIGCVVVIGSCKPKGPITETVECGGSQTHDYKGVTFTVPDGPALDVGGDCVITLVDCTINAKQGISGGGNAKVTMTGGSLTGTEAAVDVGGNAKVELKNVTIVGKISKGGNADVIGAPAGDGGLTVAENPEVALYKKGACEGYLACYDKFSAYGQVSGRIVAHIGTDGKATAAVYDEGSATADVQKCLVDVGKGKHLDGYKGTPGELTCEWSGTYIRGTQMMSYNTSFQRLAK